MENTNFNNSEETLSEQTPQSLKEADLKQNWGTMQDFQRRFIDTWVIARSREAGVFAGMLKIKEGKECVLAEAKRIWYWDGAATLSQLSKDGSCKPSECKFPEAVEYVCLTEVCEILPLTADAYHSIYEEVESWVERA